jgi:hypothetical protein
MPARFPQEAPLLVVADVQVGWTTVVVSAASVVTALVGLAAWFAAWRTAKATDRTAKAAEEQANAAEEQANAARADLHRTRTPRLDLRIGLDHGDGNVQAELVNRGPLSLARIEWEVAAFWSTSQSYPGSLRPVYGAQPGSNAGDFGPLLVGERRELQASHTHFWLRLTCVALDGETWELSLEVPATAENGWTTSTVVPPFSAATNGLGV